MSIKTLDEKLTHGVGDLYDAEHRFLEAQQKMLEKAQSATVKQMLTEHIAQTEEQIGVLEQVYQTLGEKAKRVKCAAAVGLVTEGDKSLKEVEDTPTLIDCTIASSCARVEHYEIAGYRSLISEAEALGLQPVVKLLKKNLKQEELTAKKIEASAPELLQQAMGGARAASA